MTELLLKARKHFLNGRISSYEDDVADVEKKLQSLREFRGKASTSHGDHMTNQSQRSSYVNRISTLSAKCKSAERFHSGFTSTLSSYGDGSVNTSFGKLDENIDMKIREYEDKIDNLNAKISSYASEIRSIDRDIRALEEEG